MPQIPLKWRYSDRGSGTICISQVLRPVSPKQARAIAIISITPFGKSTIVHKNKLRMIAIRLLNWRGCWIMAVGLRDRLWSVYATTCNCSILDSWREVRWVRYKRKDTVKSVIAAIAHNAAAKP